MLTLKLKGGLGNQLFQYACGRALSLRSGQELVLDASGYASSASSDTPRPFYLSSFSIVGKIVETTVGDQTAFGKLFSKAFRKITGTYHIGWDARYFEKMNTRAKAGKNIVLDGFWWSEKYFIDVADAIKQDLKLKNPLGAKATEIADIIDGAGHERGIPVSIHIRRGDYVLDPKINAYHGLCTQDYYDRAIAHLVSKLGKNIELFVFSDDIEWVKTNMSFDYPTFHILKVGPDGKDVLTDPEELILMSKCSHHVIANSSFSWWGAWLNPSESKIVIAPEKWTAKKIRDSKDMLPENWLRM